VCVLPGESAVEFKKLHRSLVSELTPTGPLEDDIVASIARLVWRKNHLATFSIAERAKERMSHIQATVVPGMDYGLPKNRDLERDRTVIEKFNAAENKARKELGEFYTLVEKGDEATMDRLMKELEVQERLDAMIDRCLKRLLFVRGLKSLSLASTLPGHLPGPPKAA
jgi:hypothetical protein